MVCASKVTNAVALSLPAERRWEWNDTAPTVFPGFTLWESLFSKRPKERVNSVRIILDWKRELGVGVDIADNDLPVGIHFTNFDVTESRSIISAKVCWQELVFFISSWMGWHLNRKWLVIRVLERNCCRDIKQSDRVSHIPFLYY